MAGPNPQAALALFIDRMLAHSSLDDKASQALLALPLREVSLAAHQPLARSAQATSDGWLVVDGLIGHVAQTDDGLRQIQELFVPGEMANLAAMMLPPRRCALEAVTKSRLVGISHAALRRVAAEHPTVAIAFAREVLRAKDILANWLLNVGRRDARARVIHFLCEMAVRYRVSSHGAGAGADFVLPMTQEQLGDALALTPVHINRTLKSLREDGLVTILRRQVSIANWAALASAGEFDPSYLSIDALDDDFHPRPSKLTSI
jgi:CRP-like cAMP-binding protein